MEQRRYRSRHLIPMFIGTPYTSEIDANPIICKSIRNLTDTAGLKKVQMFIPGLLKET